MIRFNRVHELKIIPRFYYDVISGKKNFEVRFNDRDFKVGDVIILRAFEYGHYLDCEPIPKIIKYVLFDFDFCGLKENYVVLGF